MVVYALLCILPFIVNLLECFEFLLSVQLCGLFEFLAVKEFDVDVIVFYKGGFGLGKVRVFWIFGGNGFVL